MDSSGGLFARSDVIAVANANQTIVQVIGTKRFDVVGGYVRLNALNVGASTLSIIGGGNTWLEMQKL